MTQGASIEREMVIVENGNIIVVWVEILEILVALGDDDGETFMSPTIPNDNNLSDIANESLNSMIKVSGNSIVVIWEDKQTTTGGNFDIFVYVSTNGGENFRSPTGELDISEDSSTASVRPQIAISGMNIVVVY